jgi:hypothetical protein
MAKDKSKEERNDLERISVYSKKLGRAIEVELRPQNLAKELFECVGISNADYGS